MEELLLPEFASPQGNPWSAPMEWKALVFLLGSLLFLKCIACLNLCALRQRNADEIPAPSGTLLHVVCISKKFCYTADHHRGWTLLKIEVIVCCVARIE